MEREWECPWVEGGRWEGEGEVEGAVQMVGVAPRSAQLPLIKYGSSAQL